MSFKSKSRFNPLKSLSATLHGKIVLTFKKPPALICFEYLDFSFLQFQPYFNKMPAGFQINSVIPAFAAKLLIIHKFLNCSSKAASVPFVLLHLLACRSTDTEIKWMQRMRPFPISKFDHICDDVFMQWNGSASLSHTAASMAAEPLPKNCN